MTVLVDGGNRERKASYLQVWSVDAAIDKDGAVDARMMQGRVDGGL